MIEVTRLCTGVMNNLATEQVETLKELCHASEEAVFLQWGEQEEKADVKLPLNAFGSSAWADRMERQEGLVKKYEVSVTM